MRWRTSSPVGFSVVLADLVRGEGTTRRVLQKRKVDGPRHARSIDQFPADGSGALWKVDRAWRGQSTINPPVVR
jgi:hypothetical protein